MSAHGTLRRLKHSRITFTLRAQVGRSHATLLYTDRVRHVVLATLTVSSLAIDARRGIATLRGSVVEMPSGQRRERRRMDITVVLVSHAARPSLRIRLSSGYSTSGPLLNGAITLTRSVGRSSQITTGMLGMAARDSSGLAGLWQPAFHG